MSLAREVVLITGGATGIGAGLARAWHARGATTVICGHHRDRLEAVARDHPGMEVEVVNVADVASVAACASRVATRYPDLSLLINNAGVQKLISFAGQAPVATADLDAEIDVNLKGLVYVTNAFLPLLKRQPSARIVQVSSALAFIPLVVAPLYSASKAAVHAFTIALREQLTGSSVQVIELIPPAVKTELHRGQTRKQIRQMPLEAFTEQAMHGLDSGRDEIAIGLARVARLGSRLAPRAILRVINRASS